MKELSVQAITDAVDALCRKAACDLPSDVEQAVRTAVDLEKSPLGTWSLEKICHNIDIARTDHAPLCQDTGMVIVFAEIGQDVHVVGGAFEDAINAGVARAYVEDHLRKSTVIDPVLDRKNAGDNTPAVIYTRIVPGDALTLTVMPKGAGSENMSKLGMLKPAQGLEGVKDFIVDAVVSAGGNPCPPTVVGVGIGGTADKALQLSKQALMRPLGSENADPAYRAIEEELLERINATGIGPQGFGGTVTSLAVHIETYPTHIAMLPVGVTLNCHCARHVTAVL